MQLPFGLCGGVQLCWKMLAHVREDAEMDRMWTQNQVGHVIGGRKPGRNAWPEWFKPPRGHGFPRPPCVCPQVLYAFLFFSSSYIPYLFLCFPPWWEFFFSKDEGPEPLSLTPGLVACIQCSHHCDLTISAQEPKPRIKLQAEATCDLDFSSKRPLPDFWLKEL